MGKRAKKFDVTLRGVLFCAGLLFILVSIHLVWTLEHQVDEQTLLSLRNRMEPFADDIQDEWPLPFVHVVNTRFMQHQADLVDLARARLVLFKAFCLRPMLEQSILQKDSAIPPFLWIIKTDPDLDPSVLREFISLVQSHPFIYVVGSNVNFGIGIKPGGWRGGEAGKDLLESSLVFTGDMTLLRRAHAARQARAVLETRLDADDGLHVKYLEAIQKEAFKRLRWSSSQTLQHRQNWMYWCALNRVDWTPTPPFVESANKYGAFLPRRSPQECITAGITLGISIEQEEAATPRYMHHKLYSELRANKHHPDCGNEKCLSMLQEPELAAIRSRTPTSAGMKGVSKDEKEFADLLRHSAPITDLQFRKALEQSFHIELAQVIEANLYVQEHLEQIAADNLRGQCTHGHSCKNSTKDALYALLDKVAKPDVASPP